MRKFLLLGTAAFLSACGGGGGVNSGGTVGPPAIGGPNVPPSGHTFVDPKEARTYQGVGSTHTLSYAIPDDGSVPGQGPQLYQGNSSTARNSGIQISYDPRDAIFSLDVKDPLAGATNSHRFQDSLHRTAFGGEREPQRGTPDLAMGGVLYLQQGSRTVGKRSDEVGYSSDISTFFYQKPGTTTKHVALGGYLRNVDSVTEGAREDGTVYKIFNYTFERSAFAYGERSRDQDVPTTGTGTFNGTMLATMVFNDRRDVNDAAPSYFQWVEGGSQMRVDFGKSTFELDLNGRVGAPSILDGTNGEHTIRNGAVFNANGTGRIDLALQGGFLGDFQRAWFVNPNGQRFDVVIAGSSVNGAFFGPNGQEIGGGFRIVGGRPDERIDILGAFIGKK